MGELGYGEDVDEVEEQLQGRDPLLAAVPDAQHPSMVESLRHVRLPVSCPRATGSILPSAVGISYRPNGRVFELLPASQPLVDFAQAKPYRSSRYSTVLATELTKEQLLQMAWVIATGFARREPQARYLRPPKHPPAGLMEARHTDPFGTDSFGSWDTETQMYWIVRLTALTDPTSPQDAIEVNEETLAQSLAILGRRGTRHRCRLQPDDGA